MLRICIQYGLFSSQGELLSTRDPTLGNGSPVHNICPLYNYLSGLFDIALLYESGEARGYNILVIHLHYQSARVDYYHSGLFICKNGLWLEGTPSRSGSMRSTITLELSSYI